MVNLFSLAFFFFRSLAVYAWNLTAYNVIMNPVFALALQCEGNSLCLLLRYYSVHQECHLTEILLIL